MHSLNPMPLPDQGERDRALDISRSFLVQAPAGSGKTELLTLRFLKLLAEVETPEQILAITFTRPATAEMRYRILKKLGQAKHYSEGSVVAREDMTALPLARAALANSLERGWRLLEQPQRLNIQTIDSLCLRVARDSPLTARLGGTLPPTENAAPFYRRAAQRTFDRFGGDDPELNQALKALLSLRDSNLRDCESLIAGMLATRDQWERALPLIGEIEWRQARSKLEEPFLREIRRVLGEAHALLSSSPEITQELLELANYACGSDDLKIEIRELAGSSQLPPPDSPKHWTCLANLLLKKSEDEWLLHADKRHGFPAGKGKSSFETAQKDRRKRLIAGLQQIPRLLDLLCEIRQLPPPTYTDEQWSTLRHMFVVLRHAVRELDTVFVESGSVDFTEIGNAALAVLGREGQSGVQPDPGEGIQHLLVDEFQDTSRRQHELIASLMSRWDDGQNRTVFLVGDPMQSIYMFRQAEVELFSLVGKSGVVTASGTFRLEVLRLTTNFRSTAGVVNPLNAMFASVFPHDLQAGGAGVNFLPGTAIDRQDSREAYQVHPRLIVSQKKVASLPVAESGVSTPQAIARQKEVDELLRIVQHHRPAIDLARREGKEFTVAVLARVKNHLVAIAKGLGQLGIPYRAIDLEQLGERQEVLDLQALTRALLHPMDRIAWLAVLRAPWCGLRLQDLHLLCGMDGHRDNGKRVPQELEERLHLLSDDGRERAARVQSVLRAALRSRYAQSSFSSWIERTWESLGGPACVDESGYENAAAYFQMLEQVTPDGIAATGEEMDDQLARLFALPNPASNERCGIQLMTIHKAKGLGFDVVLLPGLDRPSRRDSPTLIRYLERTTDEGTELLAAPIDSKGEDASPLSRWVRRQKDNRENEERKRLLYVACTRARSELHLFATATVTDSGPVSKSGTLLRTAWPALEPIFIEEFTGNNTGGPSNVVSFPESRPLTGLLRSVAATAFSSILYRLPLNWRPTHQVANVTAAAAFPAAVSTATIGPVERPAGSRLSRSLGTTVHTLFERAADSLAEGTALAELRSTLLQSHQQARGLARNHGLSPAEVDLCANSASSALKAALEDPQGIWILSPHAQAGNETSLTGTVDGAIQTRRIDRSFRAGAQPLSEGQDHLWIIDYKTATHDEAGMDAFLESEQMQYARQLEGYASMMRLLHGSDLHVRLALYYPMLKRLLWRRA